jgi:RNA polymerase sigma factor (TIGR02999 family)
MALSTEKFRSSAGSGGGSAPQERRVLDDMFSHVYEELRRIAGYMRRNDAGATLSSTALVNEAWIKLKDSPHLANTSEPHFKAIAARAMRQILVDAARKRHAHKRGGAGEAFFVTLNDSPDKSAQYHTEILEIDQALTRLEALDARRARVFLCRFFSEMTVPETAAELGISEASVERDWRAAKAWLAAEIRSGKE